MEETNPYAPPAAELETPADPEVKLPPFFAVAPLKLVILSLATFGYYVIYWHYRQWKAIGAAKKVKMWPIARAIFMPITSFELFPQIQAAAEATAIPVRWKGWVLALAVLLMNILSWAAQLFPGELSFMDLAWVLFIVPSFIAQFTIQELHARVVPEADRNARLTRWNLPWLALGLFFWLVLALRVVPSSRPH
jgi:hypothetical protein